MRMVLQHFDGAFRELNWSSEYERQTLLVVWIVVIHIVHAGAVVPALIVQYMVPSVGDKSLNYVIANLHEKALISAAELQSYLEIAGRAVDRVKLM